MESRTTWKTRRNLAPLTLGLVTLVLAGLTLAKVVSLSWSTTHAKGLVLQAVGESQQDPNSLQQHLAGAKGVADALKQKNLFVPRPPKEHPVKQVDGILGSEALIAGQWYGVGAKVGDAKIVAIGPTEVKIAWDGKETTFSPMAAASVPPSPAAAVKEAKKEAGPPPSASPASAVAEKKAEPVAEDPLAWMGVKMSPQMRERLLQKWNSSSEQEKEEAKQRWNSMPEEEKQQAIENMERRTG